MVYAVCSVEPEEGVAQVERFLADHPGFVREPAAGVPERLRNSHGDLFVLPGVDDLDGFYAARLVRKA